MTKATVAALFAIAFVVTAAHANDVAGLTEDEATARLVTSVAFAGLSAWAAWIFAVPGFVRKAFLELGPNTLVVRHPGVFKQPLVVPRDEIRAAAVDPRPWRWRWVGNKGRFHLGGEGVPAPGSVPPGDVPASGAPASGAPPADAAPPAGAPPAPTQPSGRGPVPEWLFSVVGGSPFPVLSNVDDVPNVAFVFSAPVRLRAVRRALRPFATKNPVHVPLQARQVRGILVRLKDIDRAAAALSAWTNVRPLTVSDVFEVEPGEAYRKRAKRRHRVANIWLTILILVEFGLPAVASLADHSPENGPSHEVAL